MFRAKFIWCNFYQEVLKPKPISKSLMADVEITWFFR